MSEPTERDRAIAAIVRDACEDEDWPALDRIVSGYRDELEAKHAATSAALHQRLLWAEASERETSRVANELRERAEAAEVELARVKRDLEQKR